MDAEKKKFAIVGLVAILVVYVIAQMILNKRSKHIANPDMAGGFAASLQRANEKNKDKEVQLDADGNPIMVAPIAVAPAAAAAH